MTRDEMSQTAKVQVTVAVIGLLGVLGGAIIANWDRIFPPAPAFVDARTTAATRAPTTTPNPTPPTTIDRVAVQNVYNLPEDRGLAIIAAQGFTKVRVLRVCSNSVTLGRIREVLLDNNAPVSDETALVTQSGSTGIEIALTTKIAVKVSNGNHCS
jgi:hypothetical protein